MPSADELPEEVDRRLAEIETELAAIDERPVAFRSRGYRRAPARSSASTDRAVCASNAAMSDRRMRRRSSRRPELEADQDNDQRTVAARVDTDDDAVTAEPETAAEPEEDEGLKPLPDRLMTELTAHRTLALRYALGEHPDIAFIAALHALCLKAFYRYGQDSCLELDLKSASFGAQAPGLADTPLATSFDARHQAWIAALPKEPTELWDALAAFDSEAGRRLVRALRLALGQCGLRNLQSPTARDGACRSARPRRRSRHGRRRLETNGRELSRPRHQGPYPRRGAGSEGRTERRSSSTISRRARWREKAQELLAGSGWLPEPLRTPGRACPDPSR